MKKIIVFLFTLLSLNIVQAKTISAGEKTSYDFDTTKKIVQEVMKDYYLRGENIQYHSPRRSFLSPEDSTSQDRQYHVCVVFSYNIFHEAFGITDKGTNKMPSEMGLINQSTNYYNEMKIGQKSDDGHFLLYYYNKGNNQGQESADYIYKNDYEFSNFIQLLQPGDIIEWINFDNAGHFVVVYDLIKDANGKIVDVLLMQSSYKTGVFTRLYGVNSPKYMYVPTSNNGIVYSNVEGTITTARLKNMKNIVKDNKIKCGYDKCMIIRPYYNNNGKTIFNYDMTDDAYGRSLVRLDYPGMILEKTVDKIDNNSVYLDDTLTYTIKITNKSSSTNGGKDSIKYDKFTIKETIDTNLVDNFKSSDCTKSGNEITCEVAGLDVDKTKLIKYSVKVKNNSSNINKVINSVGRFYGNSIKNYYITTGTVSNKIIARATNQKNSYQSCYDANKNKYSGTTLINEVYKCAWNKDYEFNNFDFTGLITKTVTTNSSGKKTMSVGFNKNMSDQYKSFKNMILNDYWSTIYYAYGYHQTDYATIPLFWSKILRKYTVNEGDFKDGDILIYYVKYQDNDERHTNEDGYYAYIYLNGKFIGVNYSEKTNERNVFDYKYYEKLTINGKTGYNNHLFSGYASLPEKEKDRILTIANYETLIDKDYYVILRPEILIANNSFSNGDVDGNGKVDISDYILIRKHILRINVLTNDKLKRADVNNDGNISVQDYVIIRKSILKI